MYLDIVETIIDGDVGRLTINKADNVIAFTLTNVGNVNFVYSPSLILYPGDSKTIGGSTLVPYHISKPVSFADVNDIKSVIVEKVVLKND
jgi:hypothetical protein